MASIDRRLDDLEQRIDPPQTCAFGIWESESPEMVKVQWADREPEFISLVEWERDYPDSTLIRFVGLHPGKAKS